MSDPTPDHSRATPMPPPAAQSAAVRILHVDDDEANRYAVSRSLRRAGFEVVEAATGREALERVRDRPDMVILDVRLPDVSGFEVCRQIKADPVTSSLPVLHLSASFVTGEDKAVGLDGGADAYLIRPVEPVELVATVNALLRQRRTEEALKRANASLAQANASLAKANDSLALVNGSLAKANASLAKNEDLLRRVIDGVQDYAIFATDTAGAITSWNVGAERVLGYPEAEALGMPVEAVFTEEDRAAGVPALEMTTAIRDGRSPDVRWHRRKDGSRFFVDGVMTALRDADGTLVGFSKLMRDVTDRWRADEERRHLLEQERQARAAAEEANRLKEEFLATLSHELRTPLNAIVGWTQILRTGSRRGNLAPDDLGEGLTIIDRNARAQTQIIEDILDMSRVVSGKLRLDVQRVDLAAVVRAGVDTVQPAASARGVGLRAILDPNAGLVGGDPSRLHQVFWNLLSNAVKFTPKGGQVQVLLERVNSHVEVSVTDTGTGIDPAFLPHVFDRFRQADASTTRRHGGLGLGLAIVKQLVELHGGSVRAKSPGNGQGSTFTVTLPLTAVDADPKPLTEPVDRPTPEEPRVAEPSASVPLAGVTVLVVDDEPDARRVVQRMLESSGAVVEAAGSAAEAIERLRSRVPAVLVSDVGMPDEDGYSLIRRVRALPPAQGGQVHAAALTAYARTADRVQALEAGFQMHLTKPVDPAELIATVAALARMATSAVP